MANESCRSLPVKRIGVQLDWSLLYERRRHVAGFVFGFGFSRWNLPVGIGPLDRSCLSRLIGRAAYRFDPHENH